jgi:hypothetical protein
MTREKGAKTLYKLCPHTVWQSHPASNSLRLQPAPERGFPRKDNKITGTIQQPQEDGPTSVRDGAFDETTHAAAIHPVQGGVPVGTIACHLQNMALAFRRQHGANI